MVRKIQSFWRLKNGLKLSKERSPAFFVRSLCHNDTEIASFDPIDTIPRDYFFVIQEGIRFWGFDLRTLIIQYETEGKLDNPYTKELCPHNIIEAFQKRVEKLRRLKKPLHYLSSTNLTPVQNWNLRVLDMCLRLDMLGYRIATQWFTDLDLSRQKDLYAALYTTWGNTSITDEHRELIVPGYSDKALPLFKWKNNFIKNDMDSIRRTNLNIMERLISSAIQQSDKTLGAMYCVMALTNVSYRCRQAYPWLD